MLPYAVPRKLTDVSLPRAELSEKNVIARATRRLDVNSESARADSKFIAYVSRIYKIMCADYDKFAEQVADILLTTDVSRTYGMNRVRFYIWHHGTRLEKERANSYMSRKVDVNHPHVDVIRIHRADNLSFDDEDPIVVKLNGSGYDSIPSLFADSVNFGRWNSVKTDRFRTGFLNDYCYFARNSSPPSESHTVIVTHVQACSSSAKMIRFADVGLVAAYVICHGYKTCDRLNKKKANETRQYVTDIVSYCNTYVRRRQCLRIEEVLTFDRLRLNKSMSDALTRVR